MEFPMTRERPDLTQFGIDTTWEDLTDEMVDDFNEAYRGQWTIDELLLHPREAAHFCNDVRRKRGYWDLPDAIILRTILTRLKHQ
jgi:hypothetical protein